MALLPASASATHNSHLEVAEFINQPGTALGGSFTTSDTTEGDPFYNPGEPTRCVFGGTTHFFGSSVFYKFHPHRNGRIRIVVQATSGDLEPVVAVHTYSPPGTSASDLTFGPCNGSSPPINRATLPPEGFLQAPTFPISPGQGYVIQVGGATVNNGPPFEETEDANNFDPATEGDFDLTLTYDPDSDGDGVFDSEDQCPSQAGQGSLGGCADSDGDGVRDPDDDCPAQAGAAGLGGCPDSDGDGIRDRDDDCPGQRGPASFRGCPDSDGDGIRDPEDDCDSQPGPASLRGCADSDGDGIRDPDDRCATLNALRPSAGITRSDVKPRDGCPDTALLHRLVGTGQDVGGTPSGILLRSFVVKGVPPGTRVLVVCRLPNGKRCGGVLVRRATTSSNVRAKAARRVSVKSLKNKRLPFGSKIVVRATAPYATGKYVRLTVVRSASRVKLVEGCMNPGSKRVRRRGCG